MKQLDLMKYEPPVTGTTDSRTWEERTFHQDGARIEVKMTEETNYRGWYDVVMTAFDPQGRRRLLQRMDVKARWDEVEVYIEHWLPQVVEGKIPRGVPVYKVKEVRD